MNKIYFLPLMLLLFFSVSCGDSTTNDDQPTHKNEFPNITPEQASQLIQTDDKLLILDIRTPEERKLGTIKNSLLVSVWDAINGTYVPPKNKTLLVFCAVGGRSWAAGQRLAQKGYQVYNLSGGIKAWHEAGLPIVRP